jgi:hypothetical protein
MLDLYKLVQEKRKDIKEIAKKHKAYDEPLKSSF